MPKSDLVPDEGYRELLEDRKGRIRSSQTKAAIAVNRELILLYWHSDKQKKGGAARWSSALLRT